MDEELKKTLEEIQEYIPVNYLKAKLVFKNNKIVESGAILKFVSMEKYQTNRAVVNNCSKPISRVIRLK